MRAFRYEQAVDTWDAVGKFRPGTAYLGGGTNLVDLMRLGVAEPDHLVDVSRLPHDQVEETADGGLRVGAAVRNSDLATHSLVRTRYPMLARAVLAGASGQVRNMATVGDSDLPHAWLAGGSMGTASWGSAVVKAEIGITGTAAAIGNAVYHATGRRVRDLPITPAKLLE
jgi:CO/xanthine dehydrogenase FAD-binding subunit